MKFFRKHKHRHAHHGRDITQVKLKQQYRIKDVETDDEELKKYLFTLGCYPSQVVTVISSLGENYVIEIFGARYSIDTNLARCVIVSELN